MSRSYRFRTLLPVALVLLSSLSACVKGFTARTERGGEEPMLPFAKLERGMTPEQVRQLVGAPKQIARQIFYYRYREQWLYEAAVPVRLTFDCPRGQKPQLLTPSGLPDNN